MTDATATIIGVIIGGLIGISGTLVGAFYVTTWQRFMESSQRLRFAFHDELAVLRDLSDSTDPAVLLQGAFKKTPCRRHRVQVFSQQEG